MSSKKNSIFQKKDFDFSATTIMFTASTASR